MYVCMYACMHVCMYACMHVCTHIGRSGFLLVSCRVYDSMCVFSLV